MSLQHVYRRGYIFWWRRVHRISDGRPLDIRISLKTFDRLEARNRGAALSAAWGGVTTMLNERIRAAEARPTEAQLQAIARAVYEEILADLCTDQRATPQFAQAHAEANLAYADYFQRLIDNGGHASLRSAEEVRLEADGWDRQRIDDLKQIVALREDRGLTPIKAEMLERHLRSAGLEPTGYASWAAELAVYPAFRDAYLEAVNRLGSGDRHRRATRGHGIGVNGGLSR